MDAEVMTAVDLSFRKTREFRGETSEKTHKLNLSQKVPSFMPNPPKAAGQAPHDNRGAPSKSVVTFEV